ncbi:hypothetical protein N9U71_00270 [Candidatus Pelagibacter sp.]|nr:hypothetical protein [Candidatus Pelagibacter sp.]
MSISIHIPFYNPNPEKKEGHRNLRRFDYLKENIENLKTLSIKNDIFVHTHNEFLDDKKLDARIIKHHINDNDLDKGYLTWKCRSLMEKQKNDYEYFSYLEHDIKFSEVNLQYWLKYQDQLNKKKYHLGFLIYEKNNSDNLNYSIHIVRKLNKYLNIEGKKFVINDLENYCCFWIYNKDQFHKFLRSKWWSFKKRAHNFRHNYGITERSSIGFHSFNMNYFKATLLPEIDNQPDPNCFLEHMTNNYYEKFSEFKNQNYMDIRGVCTLKINEIFGDLKEVKDNLYFIKLLKLLIWKLRFITRKFN